MERLITVRDMKQRYGCSNPTARKYLRQMFHYENPLTAPEWALIEWERNRARDPISRHVMTRKKEPGRVIVPRRRG